MVLTVAVVKSTLARDVAKHLKLGGGGGGCRKILPSMLNIYLKCRNYNRAFSA